MTTDRMPQPGHLYPRKGGGFLSLYVGLSGQVSARILADRFDVGFTTPLMSVADFWEMVA
jgi:hypothetical protein